MDLFYYHALSLSCGCRVKKVPGTANLLVGQLLQQLMHPFVLSEGACTVLPNCSFLPAC
jgi:hypothetical protein